MSVRRRLSVLTALIGGTLLAVPFFAPLAGAGQDQVGGYTADSLARGIEVRGGLRNIVTDPLVYLAAPFTRSAMNSIPQSAAIASVAFPGDLVYSVLKEDGVAPSQGLPASWPAADAKYPNRPERSFSVRPATEQQGLGFDLVMMTAHAKEGSNDAVVNGQRLEFRPGGAAQPPLVTIRSIETLSETIKTPTGVEQLAEVRASGIELLDGAITIDAILARTKSVSDVLRSPLTEADVRFVDVRVKDASGGSYRAVIDQDGIRIEDPTLHPSVQQGLNQALDAGLGKLGVEISGVERSRIVDGELADAAATALVINFSAACESCGVLPPFPIDPRDHIPDQVREPYNTVTCPASYDKDDPLPDALPCLTVQLIPAPTSVFRGTITVGGARAVAAATPIISFGGNTPSGGGFGGGFEPPFQPGGGGGFSPPGGFQPPGVAPPPANPQQPVVTGHPVALRAEMPDWGLTAAGAAFLAFALLLVLGPSLRRGTAG